MLDQPRTSWWQSNREITLEDLVDIRTCISRFPGLSRSELTATLCEHLEWLTPAGHPKLQACAKLLARLEAAGELRRPARQHTKSHPGSRARAGVRPTREVSTCADAPPRVVGPLAALGGVRLRLASDPEEERRCNEALARHHPLGYNKPFGYWARYVIESAEHWLGCVLLSGAAKALHARERWIGWSARQRLANLPWVVNNSRFLIFPGVEVPNLASHVLGHLARQVGDDWQARWGYRPLLLETFVDPERFRGSCYRAAGWTLLGRTSGRGLVRAGQHYQTRPKLLFAKPLQADFRALLCSHSLRGQRER